MVAILFSKNALLFGNNVVSLQRIYYLTFNIMARKSREKSATGVYHVMMRGTNKQNIFEERNWQSSFTVLQQLMHIIIIINTSDVDTSFKTVLRVNP